MNNFLAPSEYLFAIIEIGKAIHNKSPRDVVLSMYEDLLENEKDTAFFMCFRHVREIFSLSQFESLVICESVYSAVYFSETSDIGDLLEYSDGILDGLSLIFNVVADKILLNKNVLNFILEKLPSPSENIAVDFCSQKEETVCETFENDITEKIAGYFNVSDRGLTLIMKGEKDCGKTFISRCIAHKLKSALIIINGRPDQKITAEVSILSALYDGIILIKDYKGIEEKQYSDLSSYSKLLIIHTETKITRKDICNKVFFEVDFPQLNNTEKLRAFRIFCKDICDGSVAESVFTRYNLNIGQIKAICEKLNIIHSLYGNKISKQQLLGAVKDETSGTLTTGATLLSADKTFNDIILPEDQKNQLKNICNFALQREKVFGDWDFCKKITYGKGISMLFYGASGTGKTMAAQVMANEMGLCLYRVDISQLISKYIGETQKNIGSIFDKAEKTDCVLFFDEADALFSRRSDVSDSQDKYSNAEIAYLLQRTEQFSGITIMATNLFQNFDEAFKRRITFMVNFPMPDSSMRALLWKGIFPAKAPLENIDYDYLAENFELSGASIKNAALYAAYQSAADGRAIGMEDIITGIKNEYSKSGKSIDARLKLKLQQFVK